MCCLMNTALTPYTITLDTVVTSISEVRFTYMADREAILTEATRLDIEATQRAARTSSPDAEFRSDERRADRSVPAAALEFRVRADRFHVVGSVGRLLDVRVRRAVRAADSEASHGSKSDPTTGRLAR